jgi:hypothetical protein
MTSFLLSLTLLAACGEDEPIDDSHSEADTDTDTDADTDADSDTDADTDTDATWDEMDFNARKKYMQDVVSPTMKTHFQAEDAEAFADFGCATCHGSGANDGSFSMPSDMHDLDPGNMPQPDGPGLAGFMYETVVPEMATLLGTTPYDPKTNTGFGCFNCHGGLE